MQGDSKMYKKKLKGPKISKGIFKKSNKFGKVTLSYFKIYNKNTTTKKQCTQGKRDI